MKALISTSEQVTKYDGTVLGQRVAEVVPDDNTFGIAESMMWVSCAGEVLADQWYFDPVDQTIKVVPPPPSPIIAMPVVET